MALTDVVSNTGTDLMARGDSGTVTDVDARSFVDKLFIDLPAAAEVQSGVQFGQQGDEFTGSYVGGGGGGNTYSRSRVVNR
jgi:hypothetical protein